MKTTQKKLESIRKACIAANPSILDLEFGTIVKYKDATYRYISGGMAGMYTIWNSRHSAIHVNPSEIEIIGRTIRLADVLYMFQKDMSLKSRYMVDALGYFNFSDRGMHSRVKAIWNILKDDLTLQDDATIDFIYSLIESK